MYLLTLRPACWNTYHVVLMARFRPEALKITDDPCFCEYWVINQSKDIRPCAILLFTPEQYRVLGMLEEEDIYA